MLLFYNSNILGLNVALIAAKNPIHRLKIFWEKCESLPFGKNIFSKIFGILVPYSGSISPHVLEMGKGYAKVQMDDHRAVRNHLNSVHAMALANLGEVVTGMAMLYALPETHRAILIEFHVEFLKKARGQLTAHSSCQLPKLPDALDFEVLGHIQDSSGQVVSKIKALWRIGKIHE